MYTLYASTMYSQVSYDHHTLTNENMYSLNMRRASNPLASLCNSGETVQERISAVKKSLQNVYQKIQYQNQKFSVEFLALRGNFYATLVQQQ